MKKSRLPSPYPALVRLFGRIRKRERFIIATSVLTILFLASTFFSFQDIYIFIPLIFTY